MTPADRRLAAAGATLARERAVRLLARGPSPEASAEAARLATLPRDARLAALAAAVALATALDLRTRANQAGLRERPRLAALLRRLGEGRAPDEGVAPALRRLCLEHLAR